VNDDPGSNYAGFQTANVSPQFFPSNDPIRRDFLFQIVILQTAAVYPTLPIEPIANSAKAW
jgi:hypothetical protein